LWEAFEENARPELSGFQTGQITRLSDRRSHLVAEEGDALVFEVCGGWYFPSGP